MSWCLPRKGRGKTCTDLLAKHCTKLRILGQYTTVKRLTTCGCALLQMELQIGLRPCQSSRFPSAEANVIGSDWGQHCESEGLFIAETRANVQVRNPVASHSTRQPDAIDLTDFLLMLPNFHFSLVARSSRSLETRHMSTAGPRSKMMK